MTQKHRRWGTWTFNVMESFEMWIWKRLLKISWTEHRSNEQVLDMVDENRSLMNTIRQRQKNWLGHVLRSESLLRTVLEGRMKRTWTRGRQSDMMIDWMKSNDVEWTGKEKELMIEKTGVIGGLDLPEKAEHTHTRERERFSQFFLQMWCFNFCDIIAYGL